MCAEIRSIDADGTLNCFEIAVRHAQDEAAVRAGRKSAKCLFVLPKDLIKEAKVSRITPARRGTGW